MLWHVMTPGTCDNCDNAPRSTGPMVTNSVFLNIFSQLQMSTSLHVWPFYAIPNGYINPQTWRHLKHCSHLKCIYVCESQMFKNAFRFTCNKDYQSHNITEIMHKLQNQCIYGHFFGKIVSTQFSRLIVGARKKFSTISSANWNVT